MNHCRLNLRVPTFVTLALFLSIGAGCASSKSGAETQEKPATKTTNDKTEKKKTDQTPKTKQYTVSATPPSNLPKLIDREVLFGNPDRVGVKVSPDGKRLGWLAPHNGVLNVFVAPIDKPKKAEPVTSATDQPIQNFQWAYTSKDILYAQDQDGNEQYHLYRVDLRNGQTLDLTPMEGIQARIQQLSPQAPHQILASINKRSPKLHDLYQINLKSGNRKLVQKNPESQGFVGFVTTESFRVKYGVKSLPNGGVSYLKPAGDDGNGNTHWKTSMTLSPENSMSTSIVGFSQNEETLYLTDSRGRDTAALVAMPYASGKKSKKRVLATNKQADIGSVYLDPKTHKPQAAVANYTRETWIPVTDSFKPHIKALNEIAEGGEIDILSRSEDDSVWTVSIEHADGPAHYYTYDTSAKEAKFLFVHRDDLKDLPLVEMEPVVIESRDGLDLVSYLSLPPGVETKKGSDVTPKQPVPMIIHVHGGPWARVDWGYHPIHQWLTNRGYAVLSVNFRGSTGFGKEFLNAGNKEWGAKMHNDLLDARKWAIDKGITASDSVGLFGGSYGGYATLVGMTMTPDKFAVGIDIVGPSSLLTLLNTIPPYWKPMLSMFHTRVGNPNTEQGRKMLNERSPLNYVDQIKHPLLIAQGANDPRVKRAESDQIVRAAIENNVPVTYALYPNEGHGFSRPDNKMSFYAVAEYFLSQFMGGRAQKIDDIFGTSSITIPAGADYLPAVHKALCKPEPNRCEGELRGASDAESGKEPQQTNEKNTDTK